MNTPSCRFSRAAAVVATLMVTALFTTEVEAQRPGAGARAAVGAGTGAVERAIRLADELELTAEQRSQLDAMRVEILEQRTAQATALMTLRSEVAAGIREPEAMREAMAAYWSEGRADRESLRDSFDGILTDGQREQLQRMNRRGAWRQRAMRGRAEIEGPRRSRDGRAFNRGRGGRGRGR